MNHHLNSKQLARYHSLGYLDCGRVMSEAAVTELRDIADWFAAEAQADSIGLSTEPDQSYTLFTPVFTRNARYKELVLQHAVILDIVESVLGPVFRLVEDQLFYKPPRHGGALALHQDNGYYGYDEPEIVTCWIALDDATPENGCLKVLPGSHRQKVRHDPIPGSIIIRADVDESQLIDVPVAAGTLIVFDGLLVHGSGPNTTDRPRRVANMVAIVPTADGAFRKFDDTLNPYLRGVPA